MLGIPAVCIILLICALPACAAGSGPLTLVYAETLAEPSGETVRSAVSYVISPEQTIVRRAEEETIIDYRRLTITRKRTGSSVEYPLSPPDTNQKPPPSLQDGLMRQVAAYRLGKIRPGLRINGLNAMERQIWFGVGLSLAHTAIPVTVAYYGQVFGERRVQCWLSQAVTGYTTLAAIALERRKVVRANPLLLQLDPCNLILPLDGLPIRMQEQQGNTRRTLELQLP